MLSTLQLSCLLPRWLVTDFILSQIPNKARVSFTIYTLNLVHQIRFVINISYWESKRNGIDGNDHYCDSGDNVLEPMCNILDESGFFGGGGGGVVA